MGSPLNFDLLLQVYIAKKLGRRLELLVPKYHLVTLSSLEDIPEKVYSAELKPIGVKNVILPIFKLKGPKSEEKI